MLELRFRIEGFNKAAFEKALSSAIARGLNEGGDKVRTQVQRTMKTDTNVTKYASIVSRMKDSGRGWARAAPGRLAYQIVASGKGIPIKEFPVRDTGKGIDAKTWGVDHLFKRSFGIKGKGVAGFRARLGAKRLPVRGFYGPSLPKELTEKVVLATFYRSAEAYVPPAVLKHLLKSLS
ncbi:hypothetical protein [Methylocapsa acidiphila]|uniref:hypothetical protein n=1 Tax=Methylocapsa acidiphila TaxID=133552 RepID=UPI00041DBD21|nr:hypothetical protein [Methylocapsa acidiphila]